MQEVFTLLAMAALAALIIAVGGIVVWHFQDAQRVADWAVAYVYPMAKPYNSTHFWLGAQASFADVAIGRVLVNGTEYYVGAATPRGRAVWLNASGRPLLARCNSTVVIEVARGSASRALTFKAVCPRGVSLRGAYFEDVNQILREMNAYAGFVFSYLEFLNTSALAVDVVDDGSRVYIALYNTWRWPLFVYASRYDTAFAWPWYGSWVLSPTPPGPWGLLFDPTTPNPDVYNPNDYLFHFAGTLLPGDYLPAWHVGDVWVKTPSATSGTDAVTLAAAYMAFLADGFGYVNGRIVPDNGLVAEVTNPQYVGTVWYSPPFNQRESPRVYLRFAYGDILTYNATLATYPSMSWQYEYRNLGRAGATVAYVSNSMANNYKVYYGYMSTGDYPIIVYAFPAVPVVANTTSTGPQYLEIGSKAVYGETVVRGVAGLSPVRVYAVEVRNNFTHWLISVGVPGYDPALSDSVLWALSRPGGYALVEVSTGYVRIVTPDGRSYERRTPYWTDPAPGFKTYKSPIVAYLTPDGEYWVAVAGYRPSDGALLIKSNAPLTCAPVGPGLYVLPRGGSCGAMGATVKYSTETVGSLSRLVFEVWYPVARGRDGRPLNALVYRMQVQGTDPRAFFDSFSKVRAVWVEMVNSTYARAYVADYPGDVATVPGRPPAGVAQARNGTQFSVPVLYDISPKGIPPYVLYVDASAFDQCLSGRRQYFSAFGAELYYGGKLVSFYKQQLIVTKIDASCSGGTQVPITLSSPACHPVRRESLDNHTQKDFQWNPDGTYRTEVWGRFKIIEVDCNGNINARHEERILYVVRRGHGTYSNADTRGKVCGATEVETDRVSKEVRCK